MTSFIIARSISSPVDKVWSIAGNFAKSPGSGIVIETEDKGNVTDVGAVRTITIGSVRVKECLVSLDPAKKTFTYSILSGAPMKEHLAKVEFIPQGSSTEVRFQVQFSPKIPGIGWIVAKVTKRAINQYVDAVEKAVQ